MTRPEPSHPVELADEVLDDARRQGAVRTLLLDVDGTLAPIAPTPEEARVPPARLEVLRRLVRAGWRIVLVSGRPAAEVRAMVPVAGVHVFGSHGAEGEDEPGKRVIELRPAGHDKGGVVRRLASYLGLDDRPDRSFVAIGDDVTDEDMFRAIAGRGIGIRVATGAEESAAGFLLATTEDVARFLARLAGAGRVSRRD